MKKIPQQAFTAEFKELAVRRVKDGQTIPAVGRELGVSHQTVCNWVKAADAGKLTGAGSRVVTPQEMALSRLRAEVVRLQRENEIIKKPREAHYGSSQPQDALGHDIFLDRVRFPTMLNP